MIIKTKKIVREWVHVRGGCRCCGMTKPEYKKYVKPKIERARIKEYIRREIEDVR